MSPGETIVPEYVPAWDVYVEKFLSKWSPIADRAELADELENHFARGMWLYQTIQSRDWMTTCLQREGISNTEAADKLGINRAHFGRWLRGENDLAFQRLQYFYVLFGLNHLPHSPLKDRETLNVGGYLQGLIFLRAKLDGQSSDALATPRPTLETFLCLFHFYANIGPLKHLMDEPNAAKHFPPQFVAEINTTVRRYVPESKTRMLNRQEVSQALALWGKPWLLCLRLLAEEEDGITDYFISAKRPVRLSPCNDSSNDP